MPTPITAAELQALADAPGFGKAQRALEAAGYWNENLVSDGKLRRYHVTITAQARATTLVTVEGRSAEEAEDRADDLLNDRKEFHRLRWDYDELDDFEFEVEVAPKINGEWNNG